jgi:hypothetical protein
MAEVTCWFRVIYSVLSIVLVTNTSKQCIYSTSLLRDINPTVHQGLKTPIIGRKFFVGMKLVVSTRKH